MIYALENKVKLKLKALEDINLTGSKYVNMNL